MSIRTISGPASAKPYAYSQWQAPHKSEEEEEVAIAPAAECQGPSTPAAAVSQDLLAADSDEDLDALEGKMNALLGSLSSVCTKVAERDSSYDGEVAYGHWKEKVLEERRQREEETAIRQREEARALERRQELDCIQELGKKILYDICESGIFVEMRNREEKKVMLYEGGLEEILKQEAAEREERRKVKDEPRSLDAPANNSFAAASERIRMASLQRIQQKLREEEEEDLKEVENLEQRLAHLSEPM